MRLPVNGLDAEIDVKVEQLPWPKVGKVAALSTPNRFAASLRGMRLVSGLVVTVIVRAERQR